MNRFRSKKKGGDGINRSNTDEVPPLPRGAPFRSKKKGMPEPKKEFDLANALPSTDNFRTSLLMPNLSARFSMLRDQDDPNSKMGKANDDSVLYPNRASRLNFYGNNGLSDIAEVSSLAGMSVRPFANARSQSYSSADGYNTDEDSMLGGVMSRAKPGQGNKFFGGRQKIYKIPVGDSSTKDLSNGQGGAEGGPRAFHKPMGKAVYDDDISLSAFQALKAKEKEERLGSDINGDDVYGERSSKENERPGSPPLTGYNRNRETGSSTTSAAFDARTSTAATSVASQSASSVNGNGNSASTSTQSIATAKQSPITSPTGPKNKRLYGQGLDQQMYEQQSSAMHRLETIQRQRGNGSGLARSQPLYASTNFRAGSPPLSAAVESPALTGFDFGVTADRSPLGIRTESPIFGRSAPLSPPMSPGADHATFVAALEPNDLGKATASGAFNKPKTPYNEQQFAQRQIQLQQGRETPPLRAFSRNDYHDQNGRTRNDSVTSASPSVQSGQSSKAHSLTQQVAVPEPLVTHKSPPRHERPAAVDPFQAGNGTYLAGFSSEDDNDPPSPDLPMLQPTTYQSLSKAMVDGTVRPGNKYANDHEHPAYQNERVYMDLTEDDEGGPTIQVNGVSGSNHSRHSSKKSNATNIDSPTLGEGLGSGLNGLIRTHLRNDSNVSSIYPNSPPRLGGGRTSTDHRRTASHDSYDGNHWNKEQWNDEYSRIQPYEPTGAAPDPAASLSSRARQILEQATQLRNITPNPKVEQVLGRLSTDKAQQVLGEEAPRQSNESSRLPWQEQLKSHHARVGSTETQRERDDFASELADRRRRVQDNLKSFVDADSRSSSPAPGSYDSPAKSSGPLGLLRKASREAMAGRSDSTKAMKMLGMNGNAQGGPIREPQENGFSQANNQARLANSFARNTNQSTDMPQQPPRAATASSGPTLKERSIGAERREKFAARRGPPAARPGQDRSLSDNNRQPSPNPSGIVAKAKADISSRDQPQPASYRPAAHSRKYSPPRDTLSTYQPVVQQRSRSNSKTSPNPSTGQFPATTPYQASYPAPVGKSPRTPPIAPGPVTPVISTNPSASTDSQQSRPLLNPSYTFPSSNPMPSPRFPNQKFSINKQDISEPLFLSGTSSVTTVDLPPGASLQNGMDEVRAEAPPVPPFNPRRPRRTQTTQPTQNVFTAFGNRLEALTKPVEPFPEYDHSRDPSPAQLRARQASPPQATTRLVERFEERAKFGSEENEPKKVRTRLRKSSSDGGNMAAKARQQALMGASPGMPLTPTLGGSAKADAGGMF